MNTGEIISSILSKLSLLRRKMLFVLFLERLVPFSAGAVILIFSGALVESIFRFSGNGRGILLSMIIGGIAGLLIYSLSQFIKIVFGRTRRLDDEELARKVGKDLPEIKDRLLNILQLSRVFERSGTGKYSPELIQAAIIRNGSAYIDSDFNISASYKKVRKTAKYAIPLIIIQLLFFIFFPKSLGGSLERVFHPGREYPVEEPFKLSVLPGTTDLIRGTPFTIHTSASGENPDMVNVYIQEEGAGGFIPAVTEVHGDSFLYHFEKVTIPFKYFVQGTKKILFKPDQHVKSPVYTVNILHRPAVRHLKARLEAPAYSGLGSYYLADNIGDITALRGTRINLELSANKPVRSAELSFSGGERVPLEFHGTVGNGSFTLSGEGTYSVILHDNEGISNEAPIEYRLTFLQDEYPFIKIIDPGKDIDLDESMLVPLYFRVMDDYGISRVELLSQKIREGDGNTAQIRKYSVDTIAVPTEDALTRIQDIRFVWDLTGANIAPDDRVAYHLDVYDNDLVSGPKKTSSEVFYVRFPSMEEIFMQVEESQESGIRDMEEIVEEHRELQERVREIAQEMKRDPNLNWEKQRALDGAVEEQEQLAQKLDDVQERYEEILEQLENNDLTSLETLQKYAELQMMFQEMMTPELRESMENIQKTLQEQGPDSKDLQKQVDQFALSQEEFLKKIERTLNLLKHIQAEQQMDEIVKKAEELTKQQENINKELDRAGADSSAAPNDENNTQAGENEANEAGQQKLNDLARQERELASKTKEVDNRLQEMADQMRRDSSKSAGDLQEAGSILQERKVESRMQSMSGQMEKGEQQSARQEGEKLQQDLQEFSESLQRTADAMKTAEKRRVMAAMRKTMQDILELSKKQEQLAGEMKNLDNNSPKFREKAQEQANVMSGLSRTAQQFLDLSQMTFFVTPQMGKSMGEAMSQMQGAIEGMENRNGAQAAKNQEQAMSALNETASMMAGAMQSMSASQSAAGLQEYMEMLEQMAKGQQGINKETEQMMNGQSQGNSGFMRLAGEQLQTWRNRAHFFQTAAEAMRRILIDNARRKKAQKRGGRHQRVHLEEAMPLHGGDTPVDDLIALDEALVRLAAEDPTKANVVKLRYFVGLTVDQTAEILDISPTTTKLHWSYARAWLLREMA